MSRLINFKIDNSRDEKLKYFALKSRQTSEPITMTQIIKEALDMWFDKHGKKKIKGG